MFVRILRGLVCMVLVGTIGTSSFVRQSYKDNLSIDHPSIRYFQTAPDDPVGKLKLDGRPDTIGFLEDLLKQLGINPDSQMLVFSKTSFQSLKISPDNPRAIYFNDDVAVGYVRGSDSLELASIDPKLGPIFYELSIDKSGKRTLNRSEACLR